MPGVRDSASSSEIQLAFDAWIREGSFEVPNDHVARRVDLSIEEARNALRHIGAQLPREGSRILEVGAGLGFLAAFFASLGYEVVALEPAAIGFEHHRSAVTFPDAEGLTILPLGAEMLRPQDHGYFALIYSVNVLEHVGSPQTVLAALLSVLDENGTMVHACPNYHVPFEPHFGIPLVPLRPEWTEHIFRSRLRGSGLWKSLNFVTSTDVVRFAKRNECAVEFTPGLLAESLHRLKTDPRFAERHRFVSRVANLLARIGVLALAGRLPVRAATPMVFRLEHSTNQLPHQIAVQ